MNTGRFVAGSLALPLLFSLALAQVPLPVLDDKPSPQIDAGGPSAAVTALAFGADGKTLYAAGLDKVVRVWTLQKEKGFVLKTAYRVPIGPDNAGAVNAVALSPDGAWVAMAGRAPMRGEAGFRQGGVIVPAAALSPEQNRDAGVIYVASTANPAGGKVLRGHRGEVRALAFAPARKGQPPLLVSAATEREGAKHFGGLRLWDVAAGKLLAERTDLPATKARPGLAVWPTGPGATQIRVAVAWPGDQPKEPPFTQDDLHVWDPGTNRLPSWKCDPFTQTAVLLAKDGNVSVLTGGFVWPSGGRLREWDFSAARIDTVAEFPQRDGFHFRPLSLAVVPTVGGAPGHAAVVLEQARQENFRLALVDLKASRVVAEVPLSGSDKTQLPAIAASGRYLAVAAMRDRAVRVYAMADLLTQKGKAKPEAVLASDGLALQRVAFVDKGRGLWLSQDVKTRLLSGGLVFDFDKRQLRSNDRAELAADAPEMGTWCLAIDPDWKGVRVQQGQKAFPPVRLRGDGEIVTAAKLRPPAPGRPGVLAVAYTETDANRTLIMLCDPADGKPYRLLISHLQNILQLAFSASRPLLASVADDQTVCVWSLADIDSKVGEVPGLAVGDEEDKKGNKVVVLGVEPGSPAAKAKLAAGDVLEKVGAPGGEAKPLKNAASFLLAVAARRPGDEVEVTIAGKGAVKLPVDRGVDARKPLFSLFLLRTKKLPEWVGWSPAGPYDCSSAAAEAHLGWHTNTGDAAAPVSFVAARGFRKDYYREGILRYLAEEADLGRALKKWDADNPPRPPQPALRLIPPDKALPTQRADEYLVRQAVKDLRVGINDDYPLDDKHVLRWRLSRSDGGKVKAGAPEATGEAPRAGKEWVVDLSDVDWRRGEYRVRVKLHTHKDVPELATETMTLRFQPPAPVLALSLGGKALETTEQKPLKVMAEQLALQVELKQVPAGQLVEVQFKQSRNGLPLKDAPAARVQAGAGAFQQEFKLQQGLNRLAVRAVNQGALAGHEDEEADNAVVWVSYKAQELPPRFTPLRLEPEPEVVLLDGKEVWVVSQPKVRLTGKIEADGVLVEADLSTGGAPKSVLPKGDQRAADIAENLVLKAGEKVLVRLRAKSKFSDLSTAEQWVVFYPPLPAVAMDPLASADFLVDRVTLTGTVQAATEHKFKVLFRVSSSEGNVKAPEVDLKGGKWKVELTLFPGLNTVETFVANEWRGEQAVEGALKLRYRRPPQITAFPKEVEAVETNKVKLDVTVEGPAGWPLTAVKVDQSPVHFEVGKRETKGDRWVWKVELPEVFVNDGDRNLDKVSLQAVTDEGESPAAVVRVVHKKLPRLPRASFVSPVAADTARRPDYIVTYRVESERPLERVEIRRGSEVLYTADLKKVEREGALHVLQGEALVVLKNGANTLELVAVNTDGRSPRAEVVVSYTEPAVLVSIDRIEVMADNGDVQKVLKPVYGPSGDVSFPQAPGSLVWLVGRVRWSDAKATALKNSSLEVVVKVGDCRQFPVALGPAGNGDEANVRPFRVPLVLISPVNRIRVEVPSVNQQELSRREFELACAAPAKNQRLHLLIVGVNVKDAAELKKRVLDTLAVDAKDRPPGAQGEFKRKPPFERCVLYSVLAGEVDRGKVEAQLEEINNQITRLKKDTGWLNDVVLIYYQGEDVEIPEKKERWLKTSLNFRIPKAPLQSFAIPCHALKRVPGAQLLLLNVAAAPDARAAGPEWGGDADTGFMRYACNDPIEVRKADPALLGLLQEAIKNRGRLGDVVSYVDGLLPKQPVRFSPFVVLDKDQENRRISEPKR
jgi:WD40 repeat protein